MDNIVIIYDLFINTLWMFLFRNYDYCFKQPVNQIADCFWKHSHNLWNSSQNLNEVWSKFGRTELRHLGVDVWSEFGTSVVEVGLTSWLPQQPKHSHSFWNMVRICGYSSLNLWLVGSQITMMFQKFWLFAWRVVQNRSQNLWTTHS